MGWRSGQAQSLKYAVSIRGPQFFTLRRGEILHGARCRLMAITMKWVMN